MASTCNLKVAGTLVVVFLAGAAVGALTMQMGLHERLHRTVSAATLPVIRKASSSDALVQRFKTELNLSADQADKIAMVLADYREYYHSLEDQLDDVRSTGKSRIMQILDEEQRAKFEKIMGDLQPQLEAK
jgi:Spy/CpxP family protein refolding chaperone